MGLKENINGGRDVHFSPELEIKIQIVPKDEQHLVDIVKFLSNGYIGHIDVESLVGDDKYAKCVKMSKKENVTALDFSELTGNELFELTKIYTTESDENILSLIKYISTLIRSGTCSHSVNFADYNSHFIQMIYPYLFNYTDSEICQDSFCENILDEMEITPLFLKTNPKYKIVYDKVGKLCIFMTGYMSENYKNLESTIRDISNIFIEADIICLYNISNNAYNNSPSMLFKYNTGKLIGEKIICDSDNIFERNKFSILYSDHGFYMCGECELIYTYGMIEKRCDCGAKLKRCKKTVYGPGKEQYEKWGDILKI